MKVLLTNRFMLCFGLYQIKLEITRKRLTKILYTPRMQSASCGSGAVGKVLMQVPILNPLIEYLSI